MNTPTPSAGDVAKFKKTYMGEYGVELSDEEALRKLIGLLHIFPMVATPEELRQMGGARFVFKGQPVPEPIAAPRSKPQLLL